MITDRQHSATQADDRPGGIREHHCQQRPGRRPFQIPGGPAGRWMRAFFATLGDATGCAALFVMLWALLALGYGAGP